MDKDFQILLDRSRPVGPYQGASFTLVPFESQPIGSPWYGYQHLKTSEVIAEFAGAFEVLLPITTTMLRVRCTRLFVAEYDSSWHLIYWCGPDHHAICGGPPEYQDGPAAKALHDEWGISCLPQVYAIHNGLGPLVRFGYPRINSVLPLAKLTNLSTSRSDFPADSTADTQSLLAFMIDGIGNAQCFVQGDRSSVTFDWDHEVRTLSKPVDFWTIVDHRIGRNTWWL